MKKFFPILFLAVLLLSWLPALAIDQPGDLAQVTEKARHDIQTALYNTDINLSSAEKAMALTSMDSPAIHGILKDLAGSYPGVIDALIISANGTVKVIEPQEYAKYLGKSIADQDNFAALLKSKKPMLSSLFSPLEGGLGVVFHYPLFTHKGKFDGTLSLLVKPQAFLEDIISQLNQQVNQKYFYTVLQKDGVILYDNQSAQIGKNLLTDSFFDNQPDLVKTGKLAVASPQGETGCQVTKNGRDYTVAVRWDTVSLYGTEWRVLAMEVVKEKIVNNPGQFQANPPVKPQAKPQSSAPAPKVSKPEAAAPAKTNKPQPQAKVSLKAPERNLLYGLMRLSDLYLKKNVDSLTLLAATQEAQSLEWGKIKGLLTRLQKLSLPSVAVFGLSDGSYYTVDKGKVKQNLKDRDYFPALKSGKTINNALVVSKSTKQKSVVIGVPLMKNQKFAGFIGTSLYLESLSKQLKSDLALPGNCIFYALTPKGEAALHSDPSQIFLYPKKLNSTSLIQAVNKILSQKEGKVEYRFKGTTRYMYFTTSPYTGWKYCLGIIEK